MIQKFLAALAIGAVAGLIDAGPMFLRKINKFSCMAVFMQWILLGLVIPFVDWGISSWLRGALIGELGMVPFMILSYYRNKKAIVPTAVYAAILGMGISLAGTYFIGS
jgi:hypothetical protein